MSGEALGSSPIANPPPETGTAPPKEPFWKRDGAEQAVPPGKMGSDTLDVDDGQDASSDGYEPDADSEPAKATHKVKVDGEEFEVTTDELIAGYSRQRAATKRFQEAAQLQGQIKTFVGHLKSGDADKIASLFGKLGVDFDRVAETHLTKRLEELSLPPHERGKREVEREREELRRERESWTNQQREKQIESMVAVEQERLTGEMVSAFKAHGVQSTPTLIARVASEIEQATTHGYPMTIQDAVSQVLEDIRIVARKGNALTQQVGDPKLASSMVRSEAQRVDAERKREAAQVTQRGAKPRTGEQRVKTVDPEVLSDLSAFFSRA